MAYLQNNTKSKHEDSLGYLFVRILQHYSSFDFKRYQVRSFPPESELKQLTFAELGEPSETPVVVDPLITTYVNNVAKSTFRMQDIQRTLHSVLNALWEDCTCYLHIANPLDALQYSFNKTKFCDGTHTFLKRLFARASACKQTAAIIP